MRRTYSIGPKEPSELLQPELESVTAGWNQAAPCFRVRSSASDEARIVIAAVGDRQTGEHRIRRVVWQIGSALPYGSLVDVCEVSAPVGLVESLDEELQGIVLPPFVSGRLGLDGSSGAVERPGYGDDWVCLSWWMDGPAQWEDLLAWHAKASASLTYHLPDVPPQFNIGPRLGR